MWNFNELAKKAQELQEQANLAASTFSVSSGFSLNLDAMQNHDNNETTTTGTAPQPVETTTPQIKPVLHSQLMKDPNKNNNGMVVAPSRPRPIPKGKLQIPKEKQSMPPTTTTTATTNSVNTNAEEEPSTINNDPPVRAPIVSQPDVSTEDDSNVKAASEDANAIAQQDVSAEDDLNSKGNPSQVMEKEGNQEPDGVGIFEQSTDTQNYSGTMVSNPVVDDTTRKPMEQNQKSAEETSAAINNDSTDEKIIIETNETPDESSSAKERTELTQQMEYSQPRDRTMQTNSSIQSTTKAQQSLVLLVSSSDSNSMAAQKATETMLRTKTVSYETIDVMDAEAKMMIDDLIALSGIPNEFPQFFLVDLRTGNATFWGGYSRFQNGDLFVEQELFGDHANTDADNAIDIAQDPSPDSIDTETPSPETLPSASAESLFEQFTMQLKRLEDNHQTEMTEIERRHAQEMESIKASINHDECEATRIQLEEHLMAQIREKEERLRDVIQRNEGYQLKLDVLKREVEGTQALLEAKNSDMGKFSEENLKQLRSWEKKVNEAEVEIEKAKEHSKTLEISLEKSKKELSTAREEHESLRERLKTLASELKARRAECRQLKAGIDEITEEKSKLVLKIENLEFQLSDRDRSGSEKYEEIEKLSNKLSAATAEVEKLQKIVNEKDSENERLLSEYKRKTQSALAMANSRTASAIQSKEEAELEARAARSTADSAMERVVQAELKSKAAVAEARATVNAMEIQRDEAIRKYDESAAVLEEKTSKIEQLQNDLVESRALIKGKEDELATTLSDLSSEKTRSLSYQKDLTDLNFRINLLRDEVTSLREKLRHAEAAASPQAERPIDKSVPQNDSKSKEAIDSSTVAILQQELRDANQMINELKEALQNAVEVDDKNRVDDDYKIMAGADQDGHQNTNGGNDSVPLFYAMEKQAELNVARNEITRLANLLSNVQAQKMEALDNAEDMRRKMEDAEARLMRFEKLRPSATKRDSPGAGTDMNIQTPLDSGAVNIEYLKNIMLRYLNATSVSEKRALVPVIGAVLCLTHEEQQKAVASLEESISIGGVGSTLFESFSGKLTSK